VVRRVLRKVASVGKLVRTPLPDVPGFHVMTPAVLPLYHRPTIRRLNAWAVRLQVTAVRWWLRMPADPVIVCTIPTAWDVVAPMSRTSLVFNRSDRHSDFPESDRGTIAALEDQLLARSDAVLYVSRSLMTEESDRTDVRAHFLDHGVDLEHFTRRTGPEPADLAAIPGPRIGFFGSLDDYLVDFSLLEAVAREIPEAQVVLIGDATRSMDTLVALPNVHWLGFRPYEEIPDYGSGFDIALMPWLDNEWIARSNPIKMKEYLALGLPVVSTAFPEGQRYAEHIRLTSGHAEFIAAVRRSLADGGPTTPEARRRSVQSASWDARADELLRLGETARAQPTTPARY
jgi:glycosyltransferase involved in cell wall biosynthesis